MAERLTKQPFFITEQFENNRQEIARNVFASVDPALRSTYRLSPKLGKDDFTARNMRQDRNFNSAEVVGLTDGVAILWTTDTGLTHRTHRIILPDEGEPAYYGYAFDADAQSVESPPLDLQGLDAMSQHNEPVIGLFYAYDFIMDHGLKAA